MSSEKKPQNRFKKWFFTEKFSYFDLLWIYIFVRILVWVSNHLNVGWS